MHRCVYVVVIFACFQSSSPLLEWFFGGKEEDTIAPAITGNNDASNQDNSQSPSAVLAQIPFDMKVADEKFLSQAEPYLGKQMSALDICQHRIILGLQKSCSSLSEEDLAKLSVNLLNCQSAVEGRKIYPCTKSMTLKECTISMDQDTWNSYHIISNRARALCYNVRQMQFTAKTELTVDRLVNSAQQQLNTMALLKDGQEKLENIAANTYDALATGHKELIQQQDLLKDSQRNVGSLVAHNLQELAKEKALIASGHRELASMTETIKCKLSDAEKQLSEQNVQRKGSQQEVLEDILQIKLKANEVWDQIENSSHVVLQQHLNTIHHYQEALRNLQKVNATINEVLYLVERTRLDVDGKITWLMQFSKDADGNLTTALTCSLHLGYFLLGAIGAVFLNAPYVSRIVLLVTVPLNLFAEVEHGMGLDFTKLTMVVVCASAFFYLMQVLVPWLARRRPTLRTSSRILAFLKQKTVTKAVYEETVMMSDSNSGDSEEDAREKVKPHYIEGNYQSPRPQRVVALQGSGDLSSVEERLAEFNKSLLGSNNCDGGGMVLRSRSRSRDTTPIRSNTPPLVNTCCHINKKGQPCKLTCRSGQQYCRLHSNT